MSELIRIPNTSSEFLLESPVEPTTTAVVFLPGISGGAFSERFQPLVDSCLQSGFAIARVSIWRNGKEVGNKNLTDIYRDVSYVTNYLHQQGYTRIFGVGKSFGGAITLIFPSVYINGKVLWAPAIGINDSQGNIDAYMAAKLGTLNSLLDMQVDATFLKQVELPILIIHGTADQDIPFRNSERLVSTLPNAKLLPVEGGDHSYEDKAHQEVVIKATIDFLKACSGNRQ